MAGSASRKMLPPSPPSPPSGPPRGTYASRRKLTQPAPPSPPLTKMSISSMNIGVNDPRGAPARSGRGRRPASGRRRRQDADVAGGAATLELDDAVDLREQRVVGAQAHVAAGLEA